MSFIVLNDCHRVCLFTLDCLAMNGTSPKKVEQLTIPMGSPWMKQFSPYQTGICSGWMNIRGARRRRAADAGFVLSDHADWEGLISAIKATEAEKVYLTHGSTAVFGRYLEEVERIHAVELKTLFEGENSNLEDS